LSLDAFFSPQSIAVIGASTNTSKLGYAVLDNLVNGDFLRDGRKVYPINPKADEILGLPAFPVVSDIPDPIDLAVIVIPYPLVPEAMRTCGEKGIPAVIVISAGFREAGMDGLEREQELIEITTEYNIRLIGPNCLGVIRAARWAGIHQRGARGLEDQTDRGAKIRRYASRLPRREFPHGLAGRV
jgi:acetyltransferase